jgi:ParB/RepB/Spo0J family partition protein
MLLGLEDRGDGYDDLRRGEALTLSATLQGYISFRPDNPADVNSVKSHRYPSPSDQLVRYVLGRATRPYEDLLSIAKTCERPDLQARIDLDKLEIPENLIRSEPREVQALADEIAAHGGLINPITVIWVSRGTFRLVAGRRRYAAYKLLGWPSIPVRIIAGDEAHLISTQIIENDARLDMDPFTRADAYVTLKRALEAKSGECSNKDLAHALGVTPQRVSEVLKLLELPDTLRERVRQLGMGHRATVDVVRDLTKAENPEDVLKQITAQKTKPSRGQAEDSIEKAPTGKLRRKTVKFEQDGFELSVKSPNHEPPSTEVLIAKLEAFIKKLKADGQS